jgi:hypothetical protein
VGGTQIVGGVGGGGEDGGGPRGYPPWTYLKQEEGNGQHMVGTQLVMEAYYQICA